MWYLQADVLFRLIIACFLTILVSFISRKLLKKNLGGFALLLLDLAIIAYVSWQLALASVIYTITTYILIRILKRLKKTKRFWFVVFCFMCAIPFFYGRLTEFFPTLPKLLVFVGIAYSMLKAIDTLYFVYYTDMTIPLFTYANFMLFFPTFTSGPIFRYRDFANVFKNPVPFSQALFIKSLKRFIRGMFKKMVVLYFVTTLFKHLSGLSRIGILALRL